MFLDDTADKILAALPSDGRGIAVREIHARVDCWALGTVRQALVDMEREGRVVSELVPHRQGYVRMWMRTGQMLVAAE